MDPRLDGLAARTGPRPCRAQEHAQLLHAGWHVHHVEVVDVGSHEEFYFPCSNWFDKDESDGLVERVLPVGSTDSASKDNFTYKVIQSFKPVSLRLVIPSYLQPRRRRGFVVRP